MIHYFKSLWTKNKHKALLDTLACYIRRWFPHRQINNTQNLRPVCLLLLNLVPRLTQVPSEPNRNMWVELEIIQTTDWSKTFIKESLFPFLVDQDFHFSDFFFPAAKFNGSLSLRTNKEQKLENRTKKTPHKSSIKM